MIVITNLTDLTKEMFTVCMHINKDGLRNQVVVFTNQFLQKHSQWDHQEKLERDCELKDRQVEGTKAMVL